MFKKINLLGLLSLCLLLFSHQVDANPKNRPNVILIYASDMGKGLISTYGQKQFTTPNIDALINNGVSFDYAYGGSSTAHARASLLTGYHDCNKDKWIITTGGYYLQQDLSHIPTHESSINMSIVSFPQNDLFLPQVFEKAGYITAQIGLLGIGNTSTRNQMNHQGWRYFYGYLDLERGKGYYPPFLFENDQIVTIEGNTLVDCGKNFEPESDMAYKRRWNMEGKKVYSPDLFINKAVEFIQSFKDIPFFLMYSTQLPKGPVSIPAIHPEIAKNDNLTQVEKEYASMVKLLDDQVGTIMSELKKLGLEENTIIIFTSDNGHEIYYQQEDRIKSPYINKTTKVKIDNSYYKYYSNIVGDIFNGNAGLAGLKLSNLEGGINVPLVFYRKGSFEKMVCKEVVTNYDILPTMADFLGIKIESKKDGLSFLPALTKNRKLPKNRYVVVASGEGPALITNEGFKLRYFNATNSFELYNIRNDREEKFNVTQRMLKKTEELKKILLDECKGSIKNGMIY